jgi:hypothetical protein
MEATQGAEFSIKPTTEKEHFKDAPTRQFFSKWCEVNDSIEPKFVSRDEWNKQKDEGIFQKKKNEDGKQSLFIREDLKLWEMLDVIEAVDKDTYAHNPKKRQNKRKELNDLGETFVNAGIYLAQRREGIHEGKDTAIETAKDLYRYGNALRTGDYGEQTPITEIAGNTLSLKQTEEIDRWFGVDKSDEKKGRTAAMEQYLAAGRPKDAEGNAITTGWEIPDTMEQTRQEMLTQFFKVAEQAKDSEPHRKALEKAHKRYVEEPLNRPAEELDSAVFRRGLEKIVNEMGKDGWRDEVKKAFKEGMGIDLEGQEKNLREILEIPRLKTELDLARETGDVARISNKEREVANKIQEVVSKIPYESEAGRQQDEERRLTVDEGKGAFPSDITKDQEAICVGYTLIAGSLLRDVGIDYYATSIPMHSVVTLNTSDGKMYLQDFMKPDESTEIKDGDLGVKPRMKKRRVSMAAIKRGEVASDEGVKPLAVKDIKNSEVRSFRILSEELKKKGAQSSLFDAHGRTIELYPPELGEKIQVLCWVRTMMQKEGSEAASLVAGKKQEDLMDLFL